MGPDHHAALRGLVAAFTVEEAQRIKDIEPGGSLARGRKGATSWRRRWDDPYHSTACDSVSGGGG